MLPFAGVFTTVNSGSVGHNVRRTRRVLHFFQDANALLPFTPTGTSRNDQTVGNRVGSLERFSGSLAFPPGRLALHNVLGFFLHHFQIIKSSSRHAELLTGVQTRRYGNAIQLQPRFVLHFLGVLEHQTPLFATLARIQDGCVRYRVGLHEAPAPAPAHAVNVVVALLHFVQQINGWLPLTSLGTR